MTTLTDPRATDRPGLSATAGRPVASMADPGPWAILAFSTTSFMLGLYNANLVDANGVALMIPMAFVFGGVVQVIVAVLEVIRGNLFGAVVFGSFGPFWIIYALIEEKYAAKVVEAGKAAHDAGALTSALTVFLAMFTVLAVFFLLAPLRTDLVLVAALALVVLALVLLAIGVHNGQPGLERASGFVTLVFAVLGWYHGLGGLVASTFGRPVLPVGKFATPAA